MRQSPRAATIDRGAWQEGDSWNPWTGPWMTLHLYWASGEFICEDFVYMEMMVQDYCQHLGEGIILEEIKLELDDDGEGNGFQLVWKDVASGMGENFGNFMKIMACPELNPTM